MADVIRRLAQWQKKFTPERAKGALEAIYEDISRRYEAAVTEICQMEEKTREVLNLSGIHTTMFVPYLDYARELFRLSWEQVGLGKVTTMGHDGAERRLVTR